MNYKLLIVGLLILAGLLAGKYFAKKPSTKNLGQSLGSTIVNNKSAATTLPNTVDDLIKKSAGEIANPTAGAGTQPTSKVPTTAPDCFSTSSQSFECYQDYYKSLVKTKGVALAVADLKARYSENAYVLSQCHPLMHVIGRAATDIYPDVGQAYTKGDSFCWSGYYHGVMEGIIARMPVKELASKIDSICNTIPGKAAYSFDYYNCVHGLGHGVMSISNNELFNSLALCDNLTGSWEQQSCGSGAFMENVIVDNKNHFTKYLKPDQPLYPCTASPEKYKNTCYLMQTSYMLKVTNSDFKKVFQLCSTVQTYADTCYQSLGRDASGRSVSQVTPTKATCDLGTNYDQKSNCIVGAVKDFISYFHSDAQAKNLCAALDSDLQSICLSTTESYYKSF